jgi:hypothetical protein
MSFGIHDRYSKLVNNVADFNPSFYRFLVYLAHIVGHFLLASLLNQNRLTQEAGWTHAVTELLLSVVTVSIR